MLRCARNDNLYPGSVNTWLSMTASPILATLNANSYQSLSSPVAFPPDRLAWKSSPNCESANFSQRFLSRVYVHKSSRPSGVSLDPSLVRSTSLNPQRSSVALILPQTALNGCFSFLAALFMEPTSRIASRIRTLPVPITSLPLSFSTQILDRTRRAIQNHPSVMYCNSSSNGSAAVWLQRLCHYSPNAASISTTLLWALQSLRYGWENTFHANSHREKRNDQAISVFFVWEIASLPLSSYGSWYHSPCGEMKDEKCLSAQCVLELTGIIVY